MASSVNIGTLQGVLAFRDNTMAVLAKFEARLKAVEGSISKTQRTTKTETEKINEAYKRVAASLDPAVARTQKYEQQVEVLNKALKAGLITQSQYNHQLDLAKGKLQQAEHWTGRLGRSIGSELLGNFTRFFAVSALITGGIGAVIGVTKQLVQANIEAEASERRVEESVRRYGLSSGVTVDQINDLASAQSRLTGIDDELIADAETLALKFNRIGTDILPRVTQAALDISAATGQDLSSAMEKVGKLVNQPLKALTLLAREGYAVSESQTKLIKDLLATGRIAEAQAEILKILEGQYGGAAVAARDTMGGAITALQTTWENFLERVGQDNMGPLRSALESVITLLENATDGVTYVEIGFHSTRAAVNGFISDALGGIADLIDLLGDAAGLLGRFGVGVVAISADVSARARAAADVAGEDAVKHGMKAAAILAGLADGHKRGTGSALEQTEAEAKLGKEIDKLSDSIRLAIEEMQRRAENAKNLWLAALISTKAYNAELLKQKVSAAILQEENKLREKGGKLTQQQRDAIAQAVIAEDEYSKKLKETIRLTEALTRVALTATDNIAGAGFKADFKRFTDDAHHGMELIQLDVEEMLGGLSEISKLDLDIEFNSRLMDVEPHLRGVEADYLAFVENLGSGFERAGENAITAGERILETLAARFGITIDEIKAKLQELNDASAIESLQLSGRSTLQVYRDERAEINRIVESAAKQGIDITEGGQKAINDLQQSFWSENLSNWSSALGFLADEFGGFFDYLNRAVQSLQQAQGFGQNISGIASGMGASQATAGAAGAMGATVAVFALIYSWGNELIKASKSRDYGNATDFKLDNFNEGTTQLADGARQVVKSIRAAIQSVEDALRISIEDLGQIGIKVRNDGEIFKAYFKGELVGKFHSLDEALAEVLRLAFQDSTTTINGLSELMQQGLKEFVTPDFEEMMDFLGDLREISDLELGGSGSTAVQIIESVRHLDSLWQTLAKVREITPAVTRGFDNLIAAELRSWQAWSDSITGRQKTNEELLAEKKQEAVIFEAQKKFRIAELEMKRLDLQTDLAWLEGKGGIVRGDGKLKQGELELGKGFLIAKAEMVKAELTLNEQYILAIQAQIQAISDLINSLLAIPTIDVDKIKIPKNKGKGGGGDEVGDWISDKKFELDTRGLDEYRKSVLEKEREYQERLDDLGKKEKGKRAEIIALRERELDLMAQERMDAVGADYRGFVEQSNAFREVRDTASSLIASINDSPFGDADKASMIADVLAEVDDQIHQLSLEAASGLFSSLISDLDAFGYTEEQLSGMRRNLAIIEHTLKVAHYRAEFAILKAQGDLSNEILETLGQAINEFANIDPTLFMGGGGAGNGGPLANVEWLARQEMSTAVDSTIGDLERLRESFQKAKDSILETVQEFDRGEMGAITPEAGWIEAQRQFQSTIESANAGNLSAFEDAPEAFQNALDALEKFSPALFAIESLKLRDQLAKLADLSTVKEGNLIITDFEKRAQHKEVVDTLYGGFADLSSHAESQDNTQARMLTQLEKLNSSQAELNARLARLESSRLAIK